MELLQGLALESFIENFYEDKQSAAELKEIIHKYNNDNFEKVKTRLQKPTVLAGMNVDNPEEVIYSDIKQPLKNIFKHIIIFTNDKDPKNNKTLKNIYDAVKELEKTKDVVLPEVHVFNCENVELADNGKTLTISDSDEKMVIKDESNVDTLVFARLSVQNEEKCEHIVRLLQDRGLLVLNPIEPSIVACNKYDTAMLLQEHEIPQPNFCLMTKEILYDVSPLAYPNIIKLNATIDDNITTITANITFLNISFFIFSSFSAGTILILVRAEDSEIAISSPPQALRQSIRYLLLNAISRSSPSCSTSISS